MGVRFRLAVVVLLLAVTAGGVAERGHASQRIARDATAVRLEADASGRARISFVVAGVRRTLLAWGAIDALPPAPGTRQERFTVRPERRGNVFVGSCGPYAGPALPWLVAACTARDGSHWALQSWQRRLPAYGVDPTADQAAWELRLSHWSGDPATLTVAQGWAFGRFHRLVGMLSYRGLPVHGFASTPQGVPLDDFGRNVYLDTLDSAYGAGWRRENGFLAHAGTGAFCYGMYPHGDRPAGTGTAYRATVVGPGVTPDVGWEGLPPAAGVSASALLDTERQALLATDPLCADVPLAATAAA